VRDREAVLDRGLQYRRPFATVTGCPLIVSVTVSPEPIIRPTGWGIGPAMDRGTIERIRIQALSSAR
jgi:hypothetical protein